VRVSVCHCLACQRRSGSAFAVQARFQRGSVELSGQTAEFVRAGDSGKPIFQQFCPHCGTGVSYHLENEPDLLAIPAGLFGGAELPSPAYSVYEDRKMSWVEICGDGVEHWD